MPADPQSFKWYEAWGLVYLHPSEQSFRAILADPKFHIKRAFLWTSFSGALAACMVSLANQDQGKPLIDFLTTAMAVGIFLGPFVAALALLLISLPIVHASGQFAAEQDKNRFVYCVAAALAPALLGYGYLLAIGPLLARLSLDIRLVLNVLAVFLTIYFIWLVKNGFNAATKQGPGLPRSIKAVHKSLALNGGLMALAILVYCILNFVFLERRTAGPTFDLWFISWIALGFLVFFAVGVLSDLMERQPAKRLSEQGQYTDGTIVKIWSDRWSVSARSSGGDHTLEPRNAYYITLKYSAAGNQYVIQRKINYDEFMRLTEGCPVKIRYLLDEPETVQLMHG